MMSFPSAKVSSAPLPVYQPAEPPALAAKRAAARAVLEATAVPSDKKYTNWERHQIVEKLTDQDLGHIAPEITISQTDYDTGLKTIAIPLSQALQEWPDQVMPYLGQALPPEHHYFGALSQALYGEGVVVLVPKNVSVDITAIMPAASGKLNAFRTIIVLQEGAQANYTEILKNSDAEADAAQTTVVHGLEAYVSANAKLNFYGLQHWSPETTYLGTYRGQVERDGTLDWLLGHFGSQFAQIHVESELRGEGASSNVHSIFYADDQQHLDQTLLANHALPHGTSDTYTRGIVADSARQIYRGMIAIKVGAHGSTADQNGHAMLMANTARADMIPGLEIDANDVVAGHGATVGQIDEEQLFYLQARGISEPIARDLVIRGYFETLLRKIPDTSIRDRFWAAIEAKQGPRTRKD